MSFEKKKVAMNNQIFLTLVNTGTNEDDVVKRAQEIKKLQPEMMEWGIGYFEDVVLMNKLPEVAGKVKTVMDKTSVLITFRSRKFGGKTELDGEGAYLNLVKIAIDFELGNAIDIERDHVFDRVAGLIQDVKAKELGVVLS